MSSVNQIENNNTNTNTNTNTNNNSIEVRDLAIMRNIIDIASTRGTFQGRELTLVGDIYNKLDKVLKEYEKDIDDYKKSKGDGENVVQEDSATDDSGHKVSKVEVSPEINEE
tara:strand:+ start:813 stop:1148 length:336 start_codon:yes stop_codon:yes gene_type:complete